MSITREKLTGIKDLDYIILNKLSDKDLSAVCQVNTKIRHLCNDDKYWYYRIKHVFELSNEDMLRYRDMMEIDTWKEFYQWMRDIATVDINIDGVLDGVFRSDFKIIHNEFAILKGFFTRILPDAYKVFQLPIIKEEINYIKSFKTLPKWINRKELLKEWKSAIVNAETGVEDIDINYINDLNQNFIGDVKRLFKSR